MKEVFLFNGVAIDGDSLFLQKIIYLLASIDINVDLGEGIGNDALIMPLISSCNVACGGHFGSAETILQTIKLAIANNVKIGAHPSFPDKVNFGRKKMILSIKDLKCSCNSSQIFWAIRVASLSNFLMVLPCASL